MVFDLSVLLNISPFEKFLDNVKFVFTTVYFEDLYYVVVCLPSQNLHKSRYFIAWKKFRWAKNGHKFSKKGQFLPHYETRHLTLGIYRKIKVLDNFDFVKCVPACPLCSGHNWGSYGNRAQGQ